MSFTFEARTLLELGKELISTDEVAIYELIKNSVDAGSQNVEILVNVLLTHSDYKEAVARIEEEGRSRGDVLTYVQSCLISETDPGAVGMMEALALASDDDEFVGLLREWYAGLNWIEVRDTGHGMSLHELNDVFLTIGTRSRRDENLAGGRNLGDKGIGRLSAMRLGDRLKVLTTKAGEKHWNVLDIDWSLFSHDSRKSVDKIHIEPALGEEKSDPTGSGTRIIISTLQSDWTAARYSDVLQGRIARMIDPFEPGAANRLLIARFNGQRVSIPSIPRQLLDSAHAYCHVTFEMVGDEPVLTGSVDYRFRHRSIKIDERGPSVYSLTQTAIKRRAKRGHAAFSLSPVRPSALRALGRFSCDIYWFNRRVVDAVSGLTEKATETRREISNWSGGPMLYRYGFRSALDAVLKQMASLEPKDIAYLFRFRLATEGEKMGEYLEWLFGENLRGSVAETVDWSSEAFRSLDDAKLSKGIEGAFDGPSIPIARFFHRVRIDDRPSDPTARRRLGDMFIKPDEKRVLVVITPDCDLVPCGSGPKVKRLLTMDGELRSFDQDSASADHFIFYKNKPFSLKWNPKGLQTFPVSGTGSLGNITGAEFIGTLRPLYAYEAQRIALTDLGRMGLSVAPTMGVDANVTAHLRVKNGQGTEFQIVKLSGPTTATVLPERGDASKGHRVLFRRSYIHRLIDKLRGIDPATLVAEDAQKLADFLKEKNEDQLFSGFLIKGAAIKEKGPLSTTISIASKPNRGKDAAWLQFVLQLSDEAMEDLLNIDPSMMLSDEAPNDGQ